VEEVKVGALVDASAIVFAYFLTNWLDDWFGWLRK